MKVVLFAAFLGFIGCKPDVVSVDSISLRPTDKELSVGATYQLLAVVLPSDAPQDVEWVSGNPSVAIVSNSGLVTAVALGECDITATAGDKSAVCHITVVDGTPTDPSDPRYPTDGPFDNNGASVAVFSVAQGSTVHFSRGNLQYQASTGMWRFAEHQYDHMGSANRNISSDNTGWIDLFGWGTGNNPTKNSPNNSDYASFSDWGNNTISNGSGNKW